MSLVQRLKIIVKLRVRREEKLTVNSPLLVRLKGRRIVIMTGAYMPTMDNIFYPF